MDRIGDPVAHAGHGTEGVRSRAKMRHFTQIFERMTLCRYGIGVRILDHAHDRHRGRMDLDRLSLALRHGNRPLDIDCTGRGQSEYFRLVVVERVLRDDLNWIEAASIVHVEE